MPRKTHIGNQKPGKKLPNFLMWRALIVSSWVWVPHASAELVTAQAAPAKFGSNSNLSARWSDVAAINGTNVDLLAEILYQSSGKTNDFWTPGDDFAFSFKDGIAGEERVATVRWTFLESGTNNPVKMDGLTVTIDDLDDGGGRHESIETSDAKNYTLNRTTKLDTIVSDSQLTVNATGGNDLSPGDADGAVKLELAPASSFTITYRTTFSSNLDSSAYHHDLDGDFVFAEPEQTSVAATAPHVYFTYNLSNPNGGGGNLELDFFDSLPDGFLWDTSYVAFTGGSQKLDKQIQNDLVYSNGDRDATLSNLKIPPGEFILTLRTQPTDQSGSVNNDATITPKDQDPIIINATFTLTGPTNQTVVVDADVDTSIAKNAPTWNGYTSQLYATADNADPSQTLVYFDLSDNIGSDATITSAVVYLTSTDPAGTDGAFALHRIMPGVIWKGGTSYNWNVAGNGLQTDGYELEAAATDQSQLATTIPGVAGSGDRKKWDITALVQSWIDSPASNNGFAILAASPEREIFCSMEHLSDSSRPKLVISYSGF